MSTASDLSRFSPVDVSSDVYDAKKVTFLSILPSGRILFCRGEANTIQDLLKDFVVGCGVVSPVLMRHVVLENNETVLMCVQDDRVKVDRKLVHNVNLPFNGMATMINADDRDSENINCNLFGTAFLFKLDKEGKICRWKDAETTYFKKRRAEFEEKTNEHVRQGYIKQAKSGYLLFSENRDLLRKYMDEHPSEYVKGDDGKYANKLYTKAAGAMWRTLTPDEKEEYTLRALEEKKKVVALRIAREQKLGLPSKGTLVPWADIGEEKFVALKKSEQKALTDKVVAADQQRWKQMEQEAVKYLMTTSDYVNALRSGKAFSRKRQRTKASA